jgi:transcriptional regulator with XRE-family HTH domain
MMLLKRQLFFWNERPRNGISGGEGLKYPNIEAEKARLGISNEQLARKLGVSRSALYCWMKAGRIPSFALVAMAEMFHCSIDYLLGRTDPN